MAMAPDSSMSDSSALRDETAPLQVSIEVDAPPHKVWKVVADLTRMHNWSPQNFFTAVLGRRTTPGTFFVNLNRRGKFTFWPTTGRVSRVVPQQEIAFTILENGSTWVYQLTPLDDGERTLLVERRETPNGTSAVSKLIVKTALGGSEQFNREMIDGMHETLRKIKVAAEYEQS